MWWIALGIVAVIVIFRVIIDRKGAKIKITSAVTSDDVWDYTSYTGGGTHDPSSVLHENKK